jgi:hypothetical protein
MLGEDGQGEVRILFDEQRVEAGAASPMLGLATKGAGASGLFPISVYETVDCNTSQPGDHFSDVECVTYWIEDFIQADLQKWFRLVFTQGESGPSAPVTLRVDPADGGGYTLQATWGSFACDTGSGQTCSGDTVGDGSVDSCCIQDSDCESNRCCTGPDQCSFNEPGRPYTCRKPRE